MPGHQIRFNDTLDDLGWMGEEAFVLRLFHRQKESRSLLHSVHCRHCRRITRCGSQILNPKPVPISFDSSSPHPSTYVSIDDLSIPRIKLAQAFKGRAKYTNPLMEGGRDERMLIKREGWAPLQKPVRSRSHAHFNTLFRLPSPSPSDFFPSFFGVWPLISPESLASPDPC